MTKAICPSEGQPHRKALARRAVPMLALRRGSTAPVLLALVALGVAAAALALTLLRDPLGAGLSKYDFSSPEKAYESRLRIQLNKDIRAMLEHQGKLNDPKLQEKLDTLEVSKTREVQIPVEPEDLFELPRLAPDEANKDVKREPRTALFLSFKEDGEKKQEVEWFKKDEQAGMWTDTYVPTHLVREADPKLANEIAEWEGGPIAKEEVAVPHEPRPDSAELQGEPPNTDQ